MTGATGAAGATGATGATGAAGQGIISFNRTANMGGFTSPEFLQFNGDGEGVTEGVCNVNATTCSFGIIPAACSLKNLRVWTPDALGQTVTFTVRFSSSAGNISTFNSGPSCQVTSAAGNTCTDISTTSPVSLGAAIALQATWSNTLSTPARFLATVQCQ
jgi:hypothetical protein